jgi:hypothetical protein
MLQQKLGREMDIHAKNKRELEEQIGDANKNLGELRKRNMVNTIQQSGSDKGDKGDKNGAENDVNIDDLLNDLKRDIVRVFNKTLDDKALADTKQATDMLSVYITLITNF